MSSLEPRFGFHLVCKQCHTRSNLGGYEDAKQFARVVRETYRSHKEHSGFSLKQSYHAAELQHIFKQQTNRQTSTNQTFTAVPSMTITAAEMTAGKKYLIVATAQLDGSNTGNDTQARVAHDTTAFADSLWAEEPNATTTDRKPYAWWTVYTQPGTAEDISLQYAPQGAVTSGIDQATLIAIKLSDDLVDGGSGGSTADWYYHEVTANTSLPNGSDTASNNATVSFTPATANHNWLVLAKSQISLSSITAQMGSRIVSTGTVAQNTPFTQGEGDDLSNDKFNHMLARVFTLGTVAQTFAEKSFSNSAVSGTRNNSGVFALNLSKLRNHNFSYSDSSVTALSTTAFATNVRTTSITPDVQGDVWCYAFMTFDSNSVGNNFKARMRVDGTDQPDTQTADNYTLNESFDALDELDFHIQSIENLTAAAHTIDLDASESATTGTPGARAKLAFAVTMELPSAGGVARTMVINDTATLTDASPIFKAERKPVISDPLNITEAPLFVAHRAFVLNDIMTLGDLFLSVASKKMLLNDGTIALTDQNLFAGQKKMTISDTLVVTEGDFNHIRNRLMQIDDTINITDATILTKAILMVLEEQLDLQEEFNSVSHKSMLINELMNIVETGEFKAERKMLIDEMVLMSDAIIMAANKSMLINETMTFQDFLQGLLLKADRKFVLNDDLPITENLLAVVAEQGEARTFVINDNLSMSDADPIFAKQIKMQIDDGNLDLLEDMMLIGHRRAIWNEEMIITDQLETMREIKAVFASDTLDIQDEPVFAKHVTMIINDIMDLSEGMLSTRGKVMIINEALEILEALLTKVEESTGPPPGAFYPVFFSSPARKRFRVQKQEQRRVQRQERRERPPQLKLPTIPRLVEREWEMVFSVAPAAVTPQQAQDILKMNAIMDRYSRGTPSTQFEPLATVPLRRYRVEREWGFNFTVYQLIEREWEIGFNVYNIVEKAVEMSFEVKAVDWEELQFFNDLKTLLIGIDGLDSGDGTTN